MTAPALETAAADAATGPVVITEPGVYQLTAEEYHADPVPGGSLSSTGARKLVYPSTPALYKYERDNPQPPSDEMNLGSAAHRVALGAGADIVVLVDDDGEPFTDFKKKLARQRRDEALASGKIPLLAHKLAVVEAMAAALRAHPIAGRILAGSVGKPEQALFWRDGSMWKRCLVDWLPVQVPGFRMTIVEYKTTTKADNDSVSRKIYDFAYHQQLEWQLEGVRALGLDPNPDGLIIFQETKAPYLVNVTRLDLDSQMIGQRLNREATITYKTCVASGHWPGYSEDIETVGVPEWVKRQYEGEAW